MYQKFYCIGHSSMTNWQTIQPFREKYLLITLKATVYWVKVSMLLPFRPTFVPCLTHNMNNGNGNNNNVDKYDIWCEASMVRSSG